jgi:hypothetical protein
MAAHQCELPRRGSCLPPSSYNRVNNRDGHLEESIQEHERKVLDEMPILVASIDWQAEVSLKVAPTKKKILHKTP